MIIALVTFAGIFAGIATESVAGALSVVFGLLAITEAIGAVGRRIRL